MWTARPVRSPIEFGEEEEIDLLLDLFEREVNSAFLPFRLVISMERGAYIVLDKDCNPYYIDVRLEQVKEIEPHHAVKHILSALGDLISVMGGY